MPCQVLILPGDLDGGLDRLRSAAAEEDRRQVARRNVGQQRCQLNGRHRRGLHRATVGQSSGLRRHRFGNFFPSVPDVHQPQAGQRVYVLLAVDVLDDTPLPLNENPLVCLSRQGPPRRTVHPHVRFPGLAQHFRVRPAGQTGKGNGNRGHVVDSSMAFEQDGPNSTENRRMTISESYLKIHLAGHAASEPDARTYRSPPTFQGGTPYRLDAEDPSAGLEQCWGFRQSDTGGRRRLTSRH